MFWTKLLTKVFNIDTDNQDMKTIVLMSDDGGERHDELVRRFLASRNLQAEWVRTTRPVGSEPALAYRQVLSRLQSGDLLVIADVTILGHTFSAVIRELIYLFGGGVGLGIAEANTLIEASGLKGREYAQMIAFIADLFKKMNSTKTKAALDVARRHGKKIGRPSGLSRLDGKEGEIRDYLDKRVSKSAIARILGTSRTNLAHFIMDRKIEAKDSHQGGSSYGRV